MKKYESISMDGDFIRKFANKRYSVITMPFRLWITRSSINVLYLDIETKKFLVGHIHNKEIFSDDINLVTFISGREFE